MRIDITEEIERRCNTDSDHLVIEFWHEGKMVGYLTPHGFYWIDLDYGPTAIPPVDPNSEDPELSLPTWKFWRENHIPV